MKVRPFDTSEASCPVGQFWRRGEARRSEAKLSSKLFEEQLGCRR